MLEGINLIDTQSANKDLSAMQTPDRILWADERYDIKNSFATISGKNGFVPDYLQRVLGYSPTLVFIDTGLHTRETLYTVEQISKRFEVVTFYPVKTPDQINSEYPNWKEDPESQVFWEAVYYLKHEPMERVLKEFSGSDLWVAGARGREDHTFIADRGEIIQFNPFADWDEKDTKVYNLIHHVPESAFHDDPTKPFGTGECDMLNVLKKA